jgi:hypothetical protein
MPSKPYPIHLNLVRRRAVGAVATTFVDLLPTLPISFIQIAIKANLASANTSDNWTTLLDTMSSIQVRFRGQALWSVRGTDLARLQNSIAGLSSVPAALAQTAASTRNIVIWLPFGRKPYDREEILPPTAKGELDLSIDWTADAAPYDNRVYSVDVVQIPDAAPKRFVRATTQAFTPPATGDFDVDLPRGAPLLGLGIVQTSYEPSAALASIESIKILMDNQDCWYSSVNAYTMRALNDPRGDNGNWAMLHAHGENTAGAYTQNATTLANRGATSFMYNYGWLPFDITGDGRYSLDGRDGHDLKARLTYNVADATRLLPVEIWTPDMLRRTSG